MYFKLPDFYLDTFYVKKSVMAELQLNHGLVLNHRVELYNLNIIILIKSILISHKYKCYIYIVTTNPN